MKKVIGKAFDSIMGFVDRTGRDHVGAYAAQTAYFIILAFIPFLLFLLTLVKYTSLTIGILQQGILEFLPDSFQPFISSILGEIYGKSTAVLPVSAVLALWSAGKGIQALTNGLNTIYHVHETRNWLVIRIWSVFYTFLFSVSIIGTLVLLVFGTQIQESVQSKIPWLGKILESILGAKTLITLLVLFFIFIFFYKVLPNRKASLKSQAPGALMTAIAWSVFSYGFSIYFSYYPSFSNMYGSLTSVILIMLWLYICMNILLFGAEINAYYEKEIRQAQSFARDLFDKDEKKETN